MKNKSAKKLFELFFTFFKIGLFTFGGGYAMIPLIQDEVVNKKGWICDSELVDIISIAESTPGPVSVNSATYIGCKLYGFWGSVFATLGLALPSFVIIYVISLFLDAFLKIELVARAFAGIQVAVGFLVASAGIRLLKKLKRDVYSIIAVSVTVVGMVAIEFLNFSFSPIWLIVAGAALGFALTLISYLRIKRASDERGSAE